MLVLIELITYLARALSIGVRLFANMEAGRTLPLLKIIAAFLGQILASSARGAAVTLVPFALFVALVGLELAVSPPPGLCLRRPNLQLPFFKDSLELN
jgi:F-type H+-transporting ATPase subunit a